MPMYDFRCNACAKVYREQFIPLREADDIVCLDTACRSSVTILIHAPVIVGPTDTKPLEIPSIGKSFTSKGEIRQYQADNPGFQMMSKDSSDWKKFHATARERADRAAQRQGFRDMDDRRRSRVRHNR